MPTKIVECQNWNEFKQEITLSLFGDQPLRRGMFLFRGQRNCDWKLTSSFDRWFQQQGIPEATRISTAKQLLSLFRAELEATQRWQGAPDDDNYALALGQHFGLPTRLLDWTESPYVAAFFAFLEAATETPAQDLPDDRVAVWALDRQSSAWSSEMGVEIVSVKSPENSRLRNQEGHFTLSRSPFPDLEAYVGFVEINRGPINTPSSLVQFTIPATEAEAALAELDVMGVTPARLYPDIAGCVVSAKLRSRLVNIYSQLR